MLDGMKPKKSPKPTNKDKERQKEVEKRVKAEKVNLDHPKGRERFEQVVKRLNKRK